MRAVRLHRRGGPEQIVIDDAPTPTPGPGMVRIRVHAAALTPGELAWDETYRHPDKSPRLPTIPGHDVAGTVDLLGAGVPSPTVGSAVYALVNFPLDGSAAEFVVLPAADIAPAPASLAPHLAAALPLSSLTAWQALFEHGKLTAGQTVLIHGGAGGVGAYAVQLARWANARVIATTSTSNLADVRAFGADQVIDYTAQRFDQLVHDADLVLDTVGGDTLARSPAALRKGGTLVSITAPPDPVACAAAQISGVFFVVKPSGSQLRELATLVDAGYLRPSIQQVFPFHQARQAFERTLAGHLKGKVVLSVPE